MFNVSVVLADGSSRDISNNAFSSEIGGIVSDLSGALKRGLIVSIVVKDSVAATTYTHKAPAVRTPTQQFLPGDRVRQRDGMDFSNGKYEATVERIEEKSWGPVAWLKETKTYIDTHNIERVI